MAEKEYIERGALLRHIFDQIEEHGDPDPIDSPVARGSLMGLKYAHSVVSVLPAADVVEVVRCKDCKHSDFVKYCSKYECRKGSGTLKYSTDFCSNGERKTEGG